ncbi:cytochrome P450 hydroxylase [Streptomyces pristinaespiralis ATCC 25486]|uniref:Cytochrome P450 hydroxylase n=2 Tax=Streptomyces pristinaespiralis TaxID=38300 RepID=B5HAR6_STRE2|nr:cytochrome P450 hydroxylase [Streptomyces pristinaespiralis]EDY63927.1 cytochrome P450 hydroxylase [Streptomyces pristinaespiralis ATCC 25486]
MPSAGGTVSKGKPVSLAAIPRAKGSIPGLGHLPRLARDPLAVLRSLHAEGPVLRLDVGPVPVVVVTSAAAVNDLMVKQARSFVKGRLFDRVRPLVGNGLANSDEPQHMRHRRLMQPMFYKERLAGYAEVMSERADRLAGSWTADQKFDVNEVMTTFAIETLAATLFSADIGRSAVDAVREDLPIILRNMILRALAPQFTDSWPIWKKFDTAAARMRAVIDEVITATRASAPAGRTDLLSLLLSARDDTGEGLTDEQVRDELTTMLFAGSETVASTLSWALHHLAQHPDVEQQLLAEIDQVVGDGKVTFAHVTQLPSITRVLDEAIRLHGVVTLMRRTTEPVSIGGYELPAETEVLMSLYALHRNPDLYPDPDRFDPDRWLPEQVAARPREHVVPFGAGNRKCIGDRYAWMEATIALATILPRWKLRPVPGSKSPREATAAMAHPTRMPMVVLPR